MSGKHAPSTDTNLSESTSILYGQTPARGLGSRVTGSETLGDDPSEWPVLFEKELEDGIKEYRTENGELVRVIVPGGVKHWVNDFKANSEQELTVHLKGEKIHRDGAPAIECADGSEWWYQKGVKHRDGGPAVIRANGEYQWRAYGRLHRADGPAKVDEDGHEQWALYGERFNNRAEWERTLTQIRP